MAYRIDCHVHIVGNGSSGSGCRLRTSLFRQIQSLFMLKGLGMPFSALWDNLDNLYVDRILEFIRTSSLDKAVILAHDHTYDDNGNPLEDFSPIYVPNDYVLELAAKHQELIPAVSIHPAREDALAELDRCAAAGARILKCLPPTQNIDCRDERFIPFWEAMAAHEMILLAHTGGELTLPVFNHQYADPEILELPLSCGLTVIAAHCAFSSLFDRNYFDKFKAMLAEHPNLYGDNSALCSLSHARHGKRYLETADRIIHGSDLPVPVWGTAMLAFGQIGLKEFLASRKCSNPLELDLLLKKAAGFPDETVTRLSGLLFSER